MHERSIGLILSYINIILQIIVNLVCIPVLLHYIGKEQYGLYQLIAAVVAYIAIMDLGFSNAITRFYTMYFHQKNIEKAENTLAMASFVYAAIAILISFIGILIYCFFNEIFLSLTLEEMREAKIVYWILFFNVLLTVSTSMFTAVINTHEKFIFLKIINLIQTLLPSIIVIFFIKFYPNIYFLVLLQLIITSICIIIKIYYCFKIIKIKIKYYYWDSLLFNNILKLSISVFIVMVSDQIFWRSNQIILGVNIDTTAVTIYSLAMSICMNYMVLGSVIPGIFNVKLIKLFAEESGFSKMSDEFVKLGRYQILFLGIFVSGFFLFGNEFIMLWLGNGFEQVYLITCVLMIPLTIDFIQSAGQTILQVKNLYWIKAKIFIILGIINIFCIIFVSQNYNIVFCGIVSAVLLMIGNIIGLNLYYIYKVGLPVKKFWITICGLSRCFLPIILLGIALNITMDFFITSEMLKFITKITIYSTVYIVTMYTYVLTDNEKLKIKNFKAKIGD